MRLILASASPRRAAVLRDAGLSFEVLPATVDETPQPGEKPVHLVARLARAKAEAAAARVADSAIVIGADTEVALLDEVLGKPRDAEAARAMLRRLSGHTHDVLTAIYLLRLPGREHRAALEITHVHFATLSPAEISAYVATGEPFDKAGGYAIQGLAGRFIPRIEGCYFNVVGMPLARLYALLGDMGWSPDARG